MEGEPRYALEKLDAVLISMGCMAETSRVDGITRAWLNPDAPLEEGGSPTIATFRTDKGERSAGLNAVVSIAIKLRLDPQEVLQKIRDAGGEVLDP